jgi:SPP1 gp7 family putative phage head morphogenesis protein
MATARKIEIDDSPTVNEILLDRTIRHAIYLERLKKGEIRKIVALLKTQMLTTFERRVLGRLSRIAKRGGVDTGPWTTKLYQDTLTALQNVVDTGQAVIKGTVPQLLADIAGMETAWTAETIRKAVPNALGIAIAEPNLVLARDMLRTTPIDGKPFSTWQRDWSATTRGRFVETINRGLLNGDDTKQIAGAVSDAIDVSARHAETYSRTAVTHVSAQSRELVYAENSDIIDRVDLVSTLEDNTTQTCAALDGMTFPVNEGPRPPAHPRCRSSTVPVTKSLAGAARNTATPDMSPGKV